MRVVRTLIGRRKGDDSLDGAREGARNVGVLVVKGGAEWLPEIPQVAKNQKGQAYEEDAGMSSKTVAQREEREKDKEEQRKKGVKA